MRNLVSGIVGVVLGGLILLSSFLSGGAQGSGAYAAGQFVGMGFGFLLFAAGLVYLIIGVGHAQKPKSKKKKKAKRVVLAESAYLTITCSTCKGLFRASSAHAGKNVICPACKASIVVPSPQEEEEDDDDLDDYREYRRKKKKRESVPVWFIWAGGALILFCLVGLVIWLFSGGSSNDRIKMSENRITPAVFNNTRPARTPDQSSDDRLAEDASLPSQRPFPIDPQLKDANGSVFLDDLQEFGFKPGPTDWSLGKHGKLGDPGNRTMILISAKTLKNALGMHPPPMVNPRRFCPGKNSNSV